MPPFGPGWILLQVARPARTLSLQRPLRLAQRTACRNLSATTTYSRKAGNDDDAFSFSIFDEDDKGIARRRTSDLDLPGEEEAKLEARIKELEDDLRGTSVPNAMSEEMIQRFYSEEERQAIMANVDRTLSKDETLPHHVQPHDTIPQQSQVFLDKFNATLDQVSMGASRAQVRKDIWKWYARCKTNVPNFLKMIPREAWDILWKSQSAGTLGESDRSSHLRVLAQDKVSSGWTLSDAEQLAQLEGLYMDGQRSEAVKQWDILRGTDDRPEMALLETGIHMFALEGQPERAEAALDDMLRLYPKSDPRTIISVISCCCKVRDVSRAWTLYQKLQEMLGTDMRMEDYDAVCNDLLAIGEKEAALAVFRDMMLAHEQQQQQSDSFQPLKRFSELVSLAKTPQEANNLSLQSMTFLPRRWQNKMFYASWLKKLIGQGDVDAASLVVDLMYERGVSPDARHLNGLIGAWLRNGSPAARKAAEERAWAMVQKRIDFTRERRLAKTPNASVHKRSIGEHGDDITVPISISKPVPAATIETFCILVQHYLRRSEFGHVRHLRDLLVDAEIPMNSFFMNHLLNAELRNRGHRAVWSRFEHMRRTVEPDFESWIILWQCMKHHLDTVRNQDAAGFPSARNLFAQMMHWYLSLDERRRRQAAEELDIEGYNDVLRGLCLSRDLEGVFVAMHALHSLFGRLPDERTAHMIILMIARLDIRPATKQWLAHRVTRSARNTRNIAQTTEVLDLIRKHRLAQMAEMGVEVAELSTEARAEENHRTLLSLVFAVITRRSEGMDEYHAAINAAAGEMGVDTFDIQDTMALAGPE